MDINEKYEEMAAKPAWDFSSSPLKIYYVQEKNIHTETLDKSDISVHLPLLRLLAFQCDNIIEFGIRDGNSSVALLSGNPKSLISVDINMTPMFGYLSQFKNWKFIQASSTNPNLDIGHPDLLCIDSLHEYRHCLQELKMWHKKVKIWVAMHDTVSCPGVLQARNEFLSEHPEWFLAYDIKINHGMSVLQRRYTGNDNRASG